MTHVPRQSSQIIRNVLVNWGNFLVTLLTGFWMAPYLIRNLGDTSYGVWVLTGSLVGYMGLLDFGITPSIIKHVAEYRARGDQEAINRVVTGALAIFSLVGVLTLGVTLLLAFQFNRFFRTPLPDGTVAWVVFLVGLNVAVTFPASVYLGVLRGYQRYDIAATATALSTLVRSGFIVWAVFIGQGLVALAALTLLFDLMRLAWVVQSVYQINPDIKIGKEFFRREELGRLFGTSVWLFLIMVGDQLNFYTDSVVIGYYLPAAAITVYSIAFRLVGYLRSLVVEMVGVLMPAVSGLHAQEDAGAVQDLLVAGAKFTLLLALPPAALFFLLGDRFITLWVGPGYAQSPALLNVMTLGILAHLAEMTVTTVLVGTGRAHVVARFVLAQSVLNLVLSVWLVRDYGLMGVAWATTISMVLFAVVSLPIYFHHYLHLALATFLRRAFLSPLLVQVPWVLSLLCIRQWVPTPSMLLFFGVLLPALVPYAAAVYRWSLEPAEKAAFAGLKRRFGLA